MTAALAAELQRAGPPDVRFMPHVLQAIQRNAGVSERTAKQYASQVRKLFMQDGVAIEDMVSEKYLANVKRLRNRIMLTSLRSFSAWFRRHELTAVAAALAAELQRAGPLDVRCMPRVLQTFQRDAGVSERTAKQYASQVTKLFMQDGVAIEDMVSEKYLAIVRRLRDHLMLTSLRSFSTWF